MTSANQPSDAFEPLSDAESARSDTSTEGTNVCRAAALAVLLRGATFAIDGVSAELGVLGFSETVLRDAPNGWAEQSDLRDMARYELELGDNLDQSRMRGWAEVNEDADPAGAMRFLLAMLGSALERESAAAAAALWGGLRLGTELTSPSIDLRRRFYDYLYFGLDFSPHRRADFWPLNPLGFAQPPFSEFDAEESIPWQPSRWHDLYQRLSYSFRRLGYGDETFVVAVLAFARLDQALRSPDDVTRSLAVAAFAPESDPDKPPSKADSFLPPVATPLLPTVSTMIHGTWSFMGDWWRPRVGDFHRFIGERYRPNLYSGGAHFHWSGNYNERHRAKAAEYFAEWVADRSPAGIQSVFAHSYGGEIAARALNNGTPIHQLVLLSTPVTSHVKAATESNAPVVDIRLPFDPVLALARRRQRIPRRDNVTEVLTAWRLDHGATHKEPRCSPRTCPRTA